MHVLICTLRYIPIGLDKFILLDIDLVREKDRGVGGGKKDI